MDSWLARSDTGFWTRLTLPPGDVIVKARSLSPRSWPPLSDSLRLRFRRLLATRHRIRRRALSVLFGAIFRLTTVVFLYLRPVPNIVGTPMWIIHGIVHHRIISEEVN